MIFLLNHGGSLSSHATNLCGMKLLRIFRIVLLKISTFLLTLEIRTPDPIIKVGCDVNIRSIHEQEVSNIWVGSLIT